MKASNSVTTPECDQPTRTAMPVSIVAIARSVEHQGTVDGEFESFREELFPEFDSICSEISQVSAGNSVLGLLSSNDSKYAHFDRDGEISPSVEPEGYTNLFTSLNLMGQLLKAHLGRSLATPDNTAGPQ